MSQDKLREFLEDTKRRLTQSDVDTLRQMAELLVWDQETGGITNCSDSLDEHPCGHCWACSLRDEMEAMIVGEGK